MSKEISVPIEALKSGDREAFTEFVNQTSGKIYRLARQILNNSQDAEDVLQETYFKAMRALPNFEGRSSINTWLHRIAVNEALMLLRKNKPDRATLFEATGQFDSESESDEMDIVDFCCLPERELLSSEASAFLEQAVQKLPENMRLVFVMRDIEGFSTQETAEILNLSEGNVKVILLRARLRLRQELSRYYGEKIQEKDQ